MNAGIAACFAHSCRKPEPQPKWFPGRCHTAASAPENLSDTRSAVSTRLKLFQSLTLRRDTASWSDLWRGWKLWRESLSHNYHCSTPACVPFIRYSVKQIFTRLVLLPWSLCNTSVFSYWQIILPKLLGWMSPSHQRGTSSLQLLEKLTRKL